MVSEDEDRHEFMFSNWGRDCREEGDADYVEIADRVREFLEDLPTTAATFRRGDIFDDRGYRSNTRVRPDILRLCGCWKLPEYYDMGETMGDLWINPNYVHPHRYSDAVVQCRCGAIVRKLPSSGGGVSRFRDDKGHEDYCLVEWRADAIADLYRKRREILRRQALLAKPARPLAGRFHVEADDVGHVIQTLDMDYRGLKRRGYEKRLKTMVDLLRQGIPTDRVGRVYDVAPSTVRELIARKTDHDISKLRS